MTKLLLIWDYDTPLTTITRTVPYEYEFSRCLAEEDNVNHILDSAKRVGAKFTFAVLGFGAEPSVAPFDVRHVIRRIHAEGHEVASHSWKHEWLPLTTHVQLQKTIERSKYAIEKAIGDPDFKVRGFVLPHDRPMSWYPKFGFSKGDRGVYPFFPGASINGVSKYLKQSGYGWMRNSYRPVWEKLTDFRGSDIHKRLNRKFIREGDFHYVPSHVMEPNERAIEAVDLAVKSGKTIVVAAHPAYLSEAPGNQDKFDRFIDVIGGHISQNKLQAVTVSQYLGL
jgi:peptidoglycan/xylan/chitin deacetylase (PgdA/CDA1 family)